MYAIRSYYDQLDGRTINEMPTNIKQAAAVRPVYEEMGGWAEEIAGVRRFDDLPVAAKDYIKRIESYNFV